MRQAVAIAAAFAFSACTLLEPAPPSGICSTGGFAIDIEFPSAGRHDCVIAADRSVIVSVDHEPTVVEGINPSPWFAFRINSRIARTVSLTLDYTDYKHRYRPHVSTDGVRWTALPEGAVTLNERQTRATLSFDVQPGVTWVAGQPLSSAEDNVEWTRRAVAGAGFTQVEYGRSLEGRPLIGFVGGGGIHAIVALTRQHPPETTGQEAFRGFVERVLGRNDTNAIAFRGRHRIVLAPMPNPDGVDGGHWRLNAGGIDLNRDWGKFTQPETQALSAWIQQQAGDRRVVSMLDFHSTDRTVIYAPPLDAASPTIDLLPAMKAVFDAKLPAPVPWTYSHNPDGGTSKGWALDVLKAPGLAVELWDHEPIANARALGAAAADALIDHFAK